MKNIYLARALFSWGVLLTLFSVHTLTQKKNYRFFISTNSARLGIFSFSRCFILQAGGKAGKDSGKSKAKAVSRSARAGLQVIKRSIFHFSHFYFSPTFSFEMYTLHVYVCVCCCCCYRRAYIFGALSFCACTSISTMHHHGVNNKIGREEKKNIYIFLSCSLFTVSRRKNPSAFEEPYNQPWTCRCHSCRLQCSYIGIFNSRSK